MQVQAPGATPKGKQTQVGESGGIRTTPAAYKSSLTGGCVVGGVGGVGGGARVGSEALLSSTDLPPISEQEGRVSGEGPGNTSTLSAGRYAAYADVC
jgi:hypothetical protein